MAYTGELLIDNEQQHYKYNQKGYQDHHKRLVCSYRFSRRVTREYRTATISFNSFFCFLQWVRWVYSPCRNIKEWTPSCGNKNRHLSCCKQQPKCKDVCGYIEVSICRPSFKKRSTHFMKENYRIQFLIYNMWSSCCPKSSSDTQYFIAFYTDCKWP